MTQGGWDGGPSRAARAGAWAARCTARLIACAAPCPLPAALPIVPELVLNNVPSDTTAFKWFYALRLLRLARVFRLLQGEGGGRTRVLGSVRFGLEASSPRCFDPGPAANMPCCATLHAAVWGSSVFTNTLARWVAAPLAISACNCEDCPWANPMPPA